MLLRYNRFRNLGNFSNFICLILLLILLTGCTVQLANPEDLNVKTINECKSTEQCGIGEGCKDSQCVSGVQIIKKESLLGKSFYPDDQIILQGLVLPTIKNSHSGIYTLNEFRWVVNGEIAHENREMISLTSDDEGDVEVVLEAFYRVAFEDDYRMYDMVKYTIVGTKATESENDDWSIDMKSTKVKPEADENGDLFTDISGTLSNFESIDYDEVQIHVTIEDDGVIPVAPSSASADYEVFSTKAIYKIIDFKDGETKDWSIRAKITDISIEKITFNIQVKGKKDGEWGNIYDGQKTILVD